MNQGSPSASGSPALTLCVLLVLSAMHSGDVSTPFPAIDPLHYCTWRVCVWDLEVCPSIWWICC